MGGALWTIDRWGGNSNHKRRVVKQTADPLEALERFKEVAETLRQGDVRLLSPSGELVERAFAYRVRSRW